ncbi:MAG: efflux RND transporter periplasmic adaptor subunit [Nitrospiria bacterium]
MTRWVGLALLGLVIVAAAWAAATRHPPAPPAAGAPGPGGPPRGMPVEAAPVRVETLTDRVTAVGTLQANESVTIRSEIAGRITAIEFTEGRAVERDAVLFRLDAAEAAALLGQITATVELNRANYERALPLKDDKLLSPQAFDQLASRLKESEAALTVARERLNKATIRAPFAGRLGLRQISSGDYVQPGQVLVNLEDLSAIKVDFRVPGLYSGRLAPGQRVEVEVDGLAGRTFTGTIRALEPRLDEATRTILVRAGVSNPRGDLRPGMFARVGVTLGERQDALLIPEQAVVPKGADKFVFRIQDGKAALTKVALGRRAAGDVEVLSGVSRDDTVVTGGQMKIRDGMPVTVIGPAGPAAPAPPAPPKS